MLKKFNTEPMFIEVSEANKTIFKVVFFLDYNDIDIVKTRLVSRMFTVSNNKYRNINEFENRKNELLIMDYGVENVSFVDKCVFSINMTIPKEGIIEEFNMEECIKFLHDNIFDPFVKNNQFDDETFNQELEYIYDREKRYPTNIYETIDEESIKQINEIEKVYITHEEYLKNIESLNSKIVYDYYKKNIKENSYITYIYGNLDNKEKILELYNKYFKQDKKDVEIDINYNHFLKLDRYKESSINLDYNQSVLNLFYQIKDMKEVDLIFLDTLYYFLNARENDLIYNCLRNKYHLIYYLDIRENVKYGYIGIQVFLNKIDIEKAQELINEVIEDIKIESNFNIYKERLLKALKYDMYSDSDNIFSDAKRIINKNIFNDYSFEEKYNLIKEIDCSSMNNFIDRLKLTRKLIVIGDKDV